MLKVTLLLLLFVFPICCEEELGTLQNPVMCDGPSGERWYLGRLNRIDGKELTWKRLGSFGGNEKDKHLIDGYESNHGDTLFLDMYHSRYVENNAPPGYRISVDWSGKFEFKQGKIYDFENGLVVNGPVSITEETEITICKINDGVIDGNLSVYYTEGKPKRICHYLNNQRNGEETWYFSDGTIWARYTYVNGIPDGEYVIYKEDGEVSEKGMYKNGEKKSEVDSD